MKRDRRSCIDYSPSTPKHQMTPYLKMTNSKFFFYAPIIPKHSRYSTGVDCKPLGWNLSKCSIISSFKLRSNGVTATLRITVGYICDNFCERTSENVIFSSQFASSLKFSWTLKSTDVLFIKLQFVNL